MREQRRIRSIFSRWSFPGLLLVIVALVALAVGYSIGIARPSAATPYEEAVVVRVIDGDTIELEDGRRVRYIGIDTPETVHPEKDVECYGPEATARNRELVEGKNVELQGWWWWWWWW